MPARFAADSSPFLIAGPCVVESDDLNLKIGEALAELAVKLGIAVIYKASYDKANRSRLNAPRGPGLEAGLSASAAQPGCRFSRMCTSHRRCLSPLA